MPSERIRALGSPACGRVGPQLRPEGLSRLAGITPRQFFLDQNLAYIVMIRHVYWSA